MSLPARLKFGVFLAPFHRVGENPTLALERDLELLQWLDMLGFDEAYIGEHHSAGWETVPSPELFIATAAERTQHIRLGTGVVSLPYHHPYMVASRMVLLDHLTRGRVILGVGPGALAPDAYMFGIDPERQRNMMDEALGIIIRLFEETEPVTYKSDWFELREAVLQLRPYQQPTIPIVTAATQSPAGVRLAGKHGLTVLTMIAPGVAPNAQEVTPKDLWAIAEESASEHGKEVHREDWGLVISVHLAESRKEAIEDIRLGGARLVSEYSGQTLGQPGPDCPFDQIADHMIETNSWIVGTPDDCIEAIKRLDEESGGFGRFMIRVDDWAPREKVLHSYELLARYVMPQFQGSLTGIINSNRWVSEKREILQEHRRRGIDRAKAAYYAHSR